MPRFLDDDAMGDVLFAVVLRSAFCLTTNTREQTLLGNAQKHRSNGASILETTRCLRGIDLFRRLIFGYEQIRITRALLFEHIDGNGVIGQVGIVDAVCVHLVLSRPLAARFCHFAQTCCKLQCMIGSDSNLDFSSLKRHKRNLNDAGMTQAITAKCSLNCTVAHRQDSLGLEAHRAIEIIIGRNHRHAPRVGQLAKAPRKMLIEPVESMSQKTHAIRRIDSDKATLVELDTVLMQANRQVGAIGAAECHQLRKA